MDNTDISFNPLQKLIIYKPVEMKKILGGWELAKNYWSTWLAD